MAGRRVSHDRDHGGIRCVLDLVAHGGLDIVAGSLGVGERRCVQHGCRHLGHALYRDAGVLAAMRGELRSAWYPAVDDPGNPCERRRAPCHWPREGARAAAPDRGRRPHGRRHRGNALLRDGGDAAGCGHALSAGPRPRFCFRRCCTCIHRAGGSVRAAALSGVGRDLHGARRDDHGRRGRRHALHRDAGVGLLSRLRSNSRSSPQSRQRRWRY